MTGDTGYSGVQLYGAGTNATVDGGGYVGLHASDQGVTLGGTETGATVVADAGLIGIGVTGTDYTADLGGAVNGNFVGTGDTVNFTANAGDSVNVIGTGFTVTGDSGDSGAILYGAGTTATVYGGGYVGLQATNQSVVLGDAGSTVQVTTNQVDTVTGTDYVADLAGGDNGDYEGSGGTINLIANAADAINVIGTNMTVTGDAGDNGIQAYGTGTSLTVDGGGYVGLNDSGQGVTLGDAGSTVVADAGLIGIGVTGTDYTADLGGAVNGNFVGTGDTVNFTANAGDSVNVIGTGFTVTGDSGDSGAILYGAGTTATVYGGGYVGLQATNQSVVLGDAGSTVQVTTNQVDTVTGTDYVADLAGGDNGDYEGRGGTINLIANAADAINVIGTNMTVTGDAGDDGIQAYGTGTSLTVDGGGYVGLNDSGQGITLGDAGSTVQVAANLDDTVTGTDYVADLAGGDSGTFEGTQITLNLSGADGGEITSGTGNVIDNDVAGDVFNLDSNTQTTITGSGGYFGVTGTNVNVDASNEIAATWAGVSFDLQGAGNTISVGAGSSATLGGSSNTLNLSGADGGEITSGTGNVINNDVAGDVFNLDSNTQTTITGSGGYFGVTGTNVNVDASNEIAATWAGVSFDLQGASNTISVGAGSSATLGGSSNTLNLSGADGGEITSGTGNVINNDVAGDVFNLDSNTQTTITGSGGYFGVTGTNVDVAASGESSYTSVGASYNLTGIDNSLNLAMNADVNVAGSGNVLGLNGGDYAYITNGTSETVNNDVAGDIVNLGGGTQTTITGSGGYFGVVGTGVIVTASSEMSDTMDGASYDLTGGGNVLTMGASSSATISGSGNTLVLNSSDNASIATGTNEILYNEGTGDGVSFVGDSTSGTVYGDGSVAMLASNQSVTLASAGETLVSAGGVTNEAITASGDTIYEAAGVTANLHGSNDVVSLTSGTSDYLGVFGTGEMIAAGNTDLIGVQTASSATVSGTGATTLLNGSNATVNVTSSQETIDETPSLSGDVINAQANYEYIGASNTTIKVQAGESVFVNGADDKIVLAPNSGSVVAIQGTYDTVVSSGNSIVENSAQTSVTEIGGNTVYINGNDDTLNGNGAGGLVDIKNGITTYIHDDGITLNESSSDTVNFDGSSSYVNSNEYSITYIYGAGNGDNYSYNNVHTGSGAFGGDEASSYGNSGAEASYVAYDSSLNAGDQNNGSDPAGTGEEYSPGVSYNYGYSNPDSVDYSADYGDPGGGEDFVADAAVLADPSQSNLNVVASYDASVGATAQATQAIAGYAQATLAASSTTLDGAATTAVLTGAAWEVPIAADGSRTITWSFATSAGPVADPFSSYIGAQYQATFEQALQTWSDATGLTFKEVADSPDANIRVGFGDFDTGTSGILGYTDTNAVGGAQQSAIIRLEDPTETPLVSDLTGQSIYQGSEATLYQVALHEIGRALGFADNADPSSVMYAGASALNRSLDATDLAGAQILYGGLTQMTQAPAPIASSTSLTASTSDIGQLGASSLNQLIQAMATLTPQQTGTAPIQIGAQNTSLAQQLAAPLHH